MKTLNMIGQELHLSSTPLAPRLVGTGDVKSKSQRYQIYGHIKMCLGCYLSQSKRHKREATTNITARIKWRHKSEELGDEQHSTKKN